MRLLTTKPTLAWVYYGFVSTKPTHGRGYTVHVVFVNIMKKQARYNMNIPYTRNTNKYEHNIYIGTYVYSIQDEGLSKTTWKLEKC